MTKAVLLSEENLRKARELALPIAEEFLKIEPNNTMAIAETRQGAAIIDQGTAKLEAMGYSYEDAQLLFSEVVGKIHEVRMEAKRPPKVSSSDDSNF